MAIDGGPWVSMAILCERVIEDKEGVLTIVRVIDQFIVSAQATGQAVPPAMPPVQFTPTLVIGLKAGSALGRHTVSIETQTPDAITRQTASFPVHFDSPHRGHNLILRLQLGIDKEGPYWFNVKVEDRLVTRVPLQVIYAPTRLGPPGATP